MSDAIVIRGVTKTFGPKVAVDNIDLSVPEGSLYGFIGPNGAGKSTTIRMIMSIFFPDKGEISVLGKKSAVESKDRIGYLPEERGLYRKMRVGHFLTYMARLKGVDEGTISAKVRTWLDRVGLAECLRKKCEELSKGMQQKVQFIAAVMHEPDLLILDEPFSGLDPMNRKLLRELIDEQHRKGKTIIFSTHAMYEAEQLCDHLLMINRGRKVLDMTMSDIWHRFDPRTVVVEPLNSAEVVDTERLKGVAGVSSVHPIKGGFELMLAESADPATITQTVAGIVRARRIELKRVSVEDIFVNLVESAGEAGEELESLKTQLSQERALAESRN